MKRKILVIEDDQDVSTVLKVRLKANGYEVVLAADGLQGAMIANRERPNLIILDIMMPGGDGLIVARRLKMNTHTRNIPIIVLTGMPGTEANAYKAGASFYFMKPYDPDALLEAIKKTLEASESHSETHHPPLPFAHQSPKPL